MQDYSNQKFCQSCAMPLGDDPQMYGSNADGSKNDEFCCYCYEDGKYTHDCTMEQMIDICVPHMVKGNPDLTQEQAREMMKQYLPMLRRWKGRE